MPLRLFEGGRWDVGVRRWDMLGAVMFLLLVCDPAATDGGKPLHIFCMHGSYEDEPAVDSPPPTRSEALISIALEHKTQLVAAAGFSVSGLLGVWYLRMQRGRRRR